MLTKIYDGFTNPNDIDTSILFREADMIMIETPGIPSNEGYELAAALRIIIVSLSPAVNVVREIPLEVDVLDTGAVIRIPNEYTDSRFDLQLCLATAYSISLRIWVIATDCSLQTICDKVDFGNTLLTALSLRQFLSDAATLFNIVQVLIRVSQGDLTALPELVGILLPGVPSLPDLDIPALPPGLGIPSKPIYNPENIFN